jgi:hypothetical protein
LKHEDKDVREMAEWALDKIGDNKALKSLIRYQKKRRRDGGKEGDEEEEEDEEELDS